MTNDYKSRVYTDRPAYEYRQKYNAYKAERMEREKTAKKKAASGE